MAVSGSVPASEPVSSWGERERESEAGEGKSERRQCRPGTVLSTS